MKALSRLSLFLLIAAVVLCASAGRLCADQDKWITVTARFAGEGKAAEERATQDALRKAVEEACGVFLTGRSQTKDYKLVYDKVFADAVGYVKEYKVLEISSNGSVTSATIKALVSTQKFEHDWASIAHTVSAEGNPRVMIIVAESVYTDPRSSIPVDTAGIIQPRLEDFFLSKGLRLIDQATASAVSNRDKQLAVIKDDVSELAAIGARFKADVVVAARAIARYGKPIAIEGQTLYQFSGNMSVRVIQADSAALLASKAFPAASSNSFNLAGGGEKVLLKLADDNKEALLAEIVEAWRKRAQVKRTIDISIAGMDFEGFKVLRDKLSSMAGVRSVNLRQLAEGVADVEVDCEFDLQRLADMLTELEGVKLAVVEISANRLKLKVSGANP
ncbi:MAG: hypothetical protein GXY38_11820 [Planctomycetes bacterium]|nr:hypothetical protein [Planctomycetota bacterium]